MCITVNHAKLAKTKILSLALANGNHFIAYSNRVENLSGKPNAMILPIPGETKPEWFHNTETYKDFLDEITEKCAFERYFPMLSMRSAKGILQKFELGMYSVGLSNNFEGIQQFLSELPENKRPEVSEELQKFFKEKYAGWSFAICTFDSEKTIDAQPIAFEYKPFAFDLLYFPTMDGHDGKAPEIGDLVNSDHTFIYEHTGSVNETLMQDSVHLNAKVPDFLQDRKYRSIYRSGRVKNYDTYINVTKMNKLSFSEEPQLHSANPTAAPEIL